MVRLSMAASDISIHAPREGGDRPAESYIIPDTDISIHAPREGGDCVTVIIQHPEKPLFQSTPPARGATTTQSMAEPTSTFQSTPPARGATVK